MSMLLASVEILQMVNNLIANIVQFFEYFGFYVFVISIIFFFLWIIYQVGVFIAGLMGKAV